MKRALVFFILPPCYGFVGRYCYLVLRILALVSDRNGRHLRHWGRKRASDKVISGVSGRPGRFGA